MSTQQAPNPILAEITNLRKGIDRLERWAKDIERAYFTTNQKRSATPTEVMMLVCEEWEIFDAKQLQEHSNTQRAVEPRQVAAYAMQKILGMSLPQIGRVLGAFHHTTVLHGIRKVELRMASDAAFKARVERVIERLK